MRTIKLYGHLGERFGRVFRLDVRSPAEAVHALCTVLPGFREELIAAPGASGGYRVCAGADRRDGKTLQRPCGEVEPIRIVPVLCGAGKNGVGQTILGIVMVVASYLFPVSAGFLFQPGVALILGGVVQMLTKAPTLTENGGPPDAPNNKASYLFDGPVNTAAQGNPVPLCYGGPLLIGSQVVSAGMSVEQI